VGFVARAALPLRSRPIAEDDFARDRREGRMASTALLDLADELVRSSRAPVGRQVLVHGDVWPGNTLIIGSDVHALIDWKGAGVDHPGVDVGELRKQVAILFDDDAAKVVLEGWQRASGAPIDDIPYWDAVAALKTSTILRGAIVHL
jgi:aminoglycoside phosphotransferase (APT) family kinase protein